MFKFTNPANQTLSPPELPTYLKNVHDLKSITGVPSDNEIAAIHAVIRVANRVVDVKGLGDTSLHAQLMEHLFGAQIARYQSKYPYELVKDTTYIPPVLPGHVSVNLEPVSGFPSEDQLMKVHEALRLYEKYSETPSMFDPWINAELSQHLFDIQMAKFINNNSQDRPSSMQEATPPSALTSTIETGSIEKTIGLAEEPTTSSINNNRAEGTYVRMGFQPKQEPQAAPRRVHDVHVCEDLQRSNQLVGQLAEILGNINGVLVGIQHTMIRGQFRDDAEYNVREMGRMVNHRGDTIEKMDFLTRAHRDDPSSINIHIRGQRHSIYVPDTRLAAYLKFYGLEEGLCYEDHSILRVKGGSERLARERLGCYLSGCVG
ncbi:hypothetical protein RSOLAG22IIIB_07496 [Rhizoctonia solani]|uniref:Laminin domain protein n=1 Tax=Rhizoctonia solani TaxID=456999 RepID=A0A0K6FN97_9AGAM|nr:hypothetical protein RSOLAG22IIIB_07496 [Rhizoctonia solani]